MQTLEFIREKGLEALTSELAISVKKYDEGLLVLNYCQIDSPKTHPVVMECRGLILDTGMNVASRSCDRFFNVGEAPDTQKHLDFSKAVCYEKVDGSLIRIYRYGGRWEIATRGTAFAESGVNGFDITFKELVLKALLCVSEEEFQSLCHAFLDPTVTYICEITAVENRVVKRYEGYTLWFLAARKNTAPYEFVTIDMEMEGRDIPWQFPRQYKFKTVDDCLETAKHLKDLDEGYVVYQDGIPVCKIKSPVYISVHKIKGEGLSPKRIMQIVLINEQDEYLTYFPEDEKFFTPYIEAYAQMMLEMETTYEACKNLVEQKTYAIAVKDVHYSGVLFNARKLKMSVQEAWKTAKESYKMEVLETYMKSKELRDAA